MHSRKVLISILSFFIRRDLGLSFGCFSARVHFDFDDYDNNADVRREVTSLPYFEPGGKYSITIKTL